MSRQDDGWARGRSRLFGALIVWVMVAVQPSLAQALPYDEAQVDAGREAYAAECAACHGANLEGVHLAPALIGDRFDMTWRGRRASLLSFHIRRMPPQQPEDLDDQKATALLAYLLAENGIEAKPGPMPATLAAQQRLTIPSSGGSTIDETAPVDLSVAQRERLAGLSAVTDAMLIDPPASDWLQWGNTYDGQRFSTLDAINRETVDRLALDWRKPLPAGPNMPHVVVHEGVMFLHTHPDTVLALDATNGDVLWRYVHATQGRANQKLGLALADDKVLVPTSDKHVLALDAKKGTLIWDHQIELPVPMMRPRYQLRSAPLVAAGRVIQGVTATYIPKGGFILGIDLETGEKVWQFDTVAAPDDPRGNTWNDLPAERRNGGTAARFGIRAPMIPTWGSCITAPRRPTTPARCSNPSARKGSPTRPSTRTARSRSTP